MLKTETLTIIPSTGVAYTSTVTGGSVNDWYDQQTLGLTNSTLYWRNIAPRPVDTQYVTERKGSNDAIHVVVVDDTGDVTGIQGNILERFISLSKVSDAEADADAPTKTYYKDYLATKFSVYLCRLQPINQRRYLLQHNPRASGFSTSTGFKPYTNARKCGVKLPK